MLEKILQSMKSTSGMELPPKIFNEMEGELIEYVDGQSLTAKFPVKECYSNPFGFMQGGMVVAAIDNTLAPFSYLISPASITNNIDTTFVRPVKMAFEFIFVTAFLIGKTPMQVHLRAEVKNSTGKLLAFSSSSSSVIRRKTGRE
ncbi:MAG: PaaI family thioesterase [Deltaproteobacteria bacterium]|nr:PaaI family thioesterase [Deltaproteobacteria bacterium]